MVAADSLISKRVTNDMVVEASCWVGGQVKQANILVVHPLNGREEAH